MPEFAFRRDDQVEKADSVCQNELKRCGATSEYGTRVTRKLQRCPIRHGRTSGRVAHALGESQRAHSARPRKSATLCHASPPAIGKIESDRRADKNWSLPE